jgi:hypothetical protein
MTESADSLRKADKVSIRRLRFAFHLRDLEAFSEDLNSKQWISARERLYAFTETQLLALPEFFVYATYLPRIFGLAVHSRDWIAAKRLVRKIGALFKRIRKDCGHHSEPKHIQLCQDDLGAKLLQALCRALPWDSDKPKDSNRDYDALLALMRKEFDNISETRVVSARQWALRMFTSDLGREPFRKAILNGKLRADPKQFAAVTLPESVAKSLKSISTRLFLQSIGIAEGILPFGVAFPTRPLSPAEIGLLKPSLLEAKKSRRFQRYVRALRGTHFSGLKESKLAIWNKWFPKTDGEIPTNLDEVSPLIWVPEAEFGETVRIALPCISVSDESWAASVSRRKDPDLHRYTRITRLLNEVIRSETRPHYIVLPELALKSEWFNRFAAKLEKSGISLISGIEYEHPPHEGIGPNEVVNSVRVSMVTRYPGYRTHLLLSQNKESPAASEDLELRRVAGKTLVKGLAKRRIIRHGNFQFAILICSELSNIASRAHLCGKIDALFVPEWNKDTDAFGSLVEATALDLHCYVIQSNNRRYGDSRIRAPFKDSWMRDVLRLKGGADDFHACGEIDYVQLRRFQSNHQSPDKPFKPVPDGYMLHPSRTELPLVK